MDKIILEILKAMQQDIKVIKQELAGAKEEIRLTKLEVKRLKKGEEEKNKVLIELQTLMDNVLENQKNIKTKIDSVGTECESMRKDLSNIEVITASNWSDIAKLKNVK
ncbi:hypothetical protein [Clostridium felsineum]|uniref:Uncharacterized protein n=1 Tax=Clostridium felsineum TaxID=36839 RepID=A0A1S8LQR6_9CLOT|nr:hypothetical protein [Clostridium felsineum]URZ07765.1 hypothetical protein CLROS_031260 [Clostridium felsineum]URZ12796.1 hypothetical protein CROST_035410 [Clostridium felsineum]